MAYVHVLSNLTSALPKRATSYQRRKLRLSTLARKHGLDPRRQPVICSRNGAWISQKRWRRWNARPGDVVIFVVIPRDGGIKTVAALGLLLVSAIAAPYLLGPEAFGLIGAGGIFAAGSAGAAALTAATTAGLAIGSNYLLNVLIPTKPAGDLGSGHSTDSANPTYANTISAQNNLARIGAAIPALYGRVRFIPDLASAPWVFWKNQHQVLNQVFLLTQGEMEIEKIELGLTDVSAFDDVTTEVYTGGDIVTLFDPEVYTNPQVDNIILTPPNDPSLVADRGQWLTATTYTLDDYVWATIFGGSRVYYKSLSNGNVGHDPRSTVGFWQTIGSSIAAGGSTVFKGPFAITPPGVTCAQIEVDLSFPAGMYTLNPSTGNPDPIAIQFVFNIQGIDDSGTPIGGWGFLAAETADSTGGEIINVVTPGVVELGGGYLYVGQRTSPITVTLRIDLPDPDIRYQIRAFRNSDKVLTGTVGHDISWAGLRAILPARGYGDTTVLAIQISNTANSSVNGQSARQVAVTGTRKLPVYSGGAWQPAETTRNIAWAVADMLKNSTYGGKLGDAQYDLDALLTLAATWNSRSDLFDFYASQTTTLWAALGLALRAGRTVPYHQSGLVRFHRDAAQSIPTMLFSAENIVKGSFKMNFILPSPEDETDSIQVDYVDQRTWTKTSLLLPKAGVIDPQSPSINSLDGVVFAEQTEREADYMLAADRYRRVLLSFDTEMEGLIASRGDLILVQHDMPRWGQTTRIYDWDAGTNTITAWGRVDFTGSGTWFAYFRDRRGRASAEVQIASFDDDTLEIILASAPTYPLGGAFDMTATRSEPLHMVVGLADAVPRQAILLGAMPRGGKLVSVTAVLEDSRVHVN